MALTPGGKDRTAMCNELCGLHPERIDVSLTMHHRITRAYEAAKIVICCERWQMHNIPTQRRLLLLSACQPRMICNPTGKWRVDEARQMQADIGVASGIVTRSGFCAESATTALTIAAIGQRFTVDEEKYDGRRP